MSKPHISITVGLSPMLLVVAGLLSNIPAWLTITLIDEHLCLSPPMPPLMITGKLYPHPLSYSRERRALRILVAMFSRDWFAVCLSLFLMVPYLVYSYDSSIVDRTLTYVEKVRGDAIRGYMHLRASGLRKVLVGVVDTQSRCVRDEWRDQDLPPMRPDAYIKVGRQKCKPSLGCQLIGVGVASAIPVVMRGCTCNMVVALRTRVLAMTARAGEHGDAISAKWSAVDWHSRVGMLRAHILEPLLNGCRRIDHPLHVPPLPNASGGKRRLAPLPFETWLAGYTEGEKTRFRVVRSILDRRPLRKNDMVLKSFVKTDERMIHYTTAMAHGKRKPKPRAIQGRTDLAKVAMGPFMSSYGKRLATVLHCCDATLPVATAMGRTAEEMGVWMANSISHCGPECVVVDADVVMWDANTCIEALRLLEHDYHALCADADVMKIVTSRDENVGRTRVGVGFGWGPGSVRSGDGDTSAGNNRIHATLLLSVFSNLGILDQVRALIAGDDLVVVFTQWAWQRVRRAGGLVFLYEEFGYTLELNTHGSSYWRANFCSGRFYPTATGIKFGPLPGRILAKTFWSNTPFSRDSKRDAHVRGMCLGLENICSHIPILRVVIRRMLDLINRSGDVAVSFNRYTAFAAKSCDIAGPDMPAVFLDLYGLGPDEVASLEKWIFNSIQIPCLLSHPLLDIIVAKDTQ